MTNLLDEVFAPNPPADMPWGVNFGGGVNSTALLLLAYERGLRPDWVLFSDTGSERPETYENVEKVAAWCKKVGFPFETVRWIRKDGSFESVHDNCLRTNYLPSKAYGLAGCTFKWKIQPMQRWRKKNGFAKTAIAIGYDAGEKRRIQAAKKRACDETDLFPSERWWYPLVAWGVDRIACLAALEKYGFPTVKSSCFVCPNMKTDEWDDLKQSHPALFSIAEQIQTNAQAAGNAETKTLFRSYKPNAACVCFADGCSAPNQQEIDYA